VNLGATISREQQRPEPVTYSRHNETNSRRVDVEQSSLGRQRERSTAVKPPLTSTTPTFKRGRRYRTTRVVAVQKYVVAFDADVGHRRAAPKSGRPCSCCRRTTPLLG